MSVPRRSYVAAWATAAMLFVAVPAGAQMTPVADLRSLGASATYEGQTDTQTYTFSFFAPMNDVLSALVEGVEAGHASADAYQQSEFTSATIFFSGSTAGQWQINPGSYAAHSIASFRVRMDTCVDINLYAQIDPGDDVEGFLNGFVQLKHAGGTLFRIESGDSLHVGRLGPGEYTFESKSSVGNIEESLQGATYAMAFWCTPCAVPLIATQPQDQMIDCTNDVTLCVTTSAPPGGLTFQWRRNLEPLTNSAHISGATSSCLTISGACDADIGYYDVVVTSGGLSEPSQLAYVGPKGTTGVGPVAGSADAFELGPAMPNPSNGDVMCRFSAPQAFEAPVEIYDAAGRLVRRLEPRLFSGPGSILWDGRGSVGAPVSAGIYFVRVVHPEAPRFQRVAIVR